MLVGFSLGLKDNTRIKREKERRRTKRMKCFGLEEEVLDPIDLIELPTSYVVWCKCERANFEGAFIFQMGL